MPNGLLCWLFPRVLDLVMQQKQMVPFRERIGKAASGRVLDIGIGSGLIPFMGSKPIMFVASIPLQNCCNSPRNAPKRHMFRSSFCAAPEKHCHWTTKAWIRW
jgi:hypothetical protein